MSERLKDKIKVGMNFGLTQDNRLFLYQFLDFLTFFFNVLFQCSIFHLNQVGFATLNEHFSRRLSPSQNVRRYHLHTHLHTTHDSWVVPFWSIFQSWPLLNLEVGFKCKNSLNFSIFRFFFKFFIQNDSEKVTNRLFWLK